MPLPSRTPSLAPAEHASLHDETRQLESSCAALRDDQAASKATIGRQAERLRGLEEEVAGLRRESTEMASSARALKSGLKDAVDRQKASEQKLHRQIDAIEVRHDGYDEAIATFAEALKLANPLAESLSRAAAAL